MEMKFLGLIHVVMFVSEYLSKLLKLSRFATHQVNTEAGKCQRFQEGLKPQIREKVSLLELEQFDKLVGEAKTAEREYESRNQFFNSKKRGRELEPDNIRRSGGNIGVQVNKKENSEGNEKRMTLTECQKCGLKHLGTFSSMLKVYILIMGKRIICQCNAQSQRQFCAITVGTGTFVKRLSSQDS